jgi:hypothetical protein
MHYFARIDVADERDVFLADRQIDGWRYAYLRSVEKSRRRLVREAKPFDMTLFIVEADRRRRYVAHIVGVECLRESHARAAHDVLARCGWLDTNAAAFVPADADDPPGDGVFNVRFRLDDISRYPLGAFASNDDPVMQLNRYQLHGVDDPVRPQPLRSPEYAAMRERLVAQLRAAHPHAPIEFDAADADVLMRDDETTYVFQIRTELDPREALRRALVCAMRHWLDSSADPHAARLVVVVRAEPGAGDLRYLSLLRGMFGLPIVCRVVAADPPE